MQSNMEKTARVINVNQDTLSGVIKGQVHALQGNTR